MYFRDYACVYVHQRCVCGDVHVCTCVIHCVLVGICTVSEAYSMFMFLCVFVCVYVCAICCVLSGECCVSCVWIINIYSYVCMYNMYVCM